MPICIQLIQPPGRELIVKRKLPAHACVGASPRESGEVLVDGLKMIEIQFKVRKGVLSKTPAGRCVETYTAGGQNPRVLRIDDAGDFRIGECRIRRFNPVDGHRRAVPVETRASADAQLDVPPGSYAEIQ